ncbi:hypothetical protein BC2230_120190 [Burkholderia cepacia]
MSTGRCQIKVATKQTRLNCLDRTRPDIRCETFYLNAHQFRQCATFIHGFFLAFCERLPANDIAVVSHKVVKLLVSAQPWEFLKRVL